MEPIISPWLIYLLGLIDNLGTVFSLVAILGGIALLFVWAFVIGYYGEEIDESDDDEWKQIKRFMKKTTAIWAVITVLAVFLPSKKTVIGMCVADVITYDAAEKIVKTGKDVKDEIKKDILDLIDTIQNDKKVEENSK